MPPSAAHRRKLTAQLAGIAGCLLSEAQTTLEACDWDLEAACNLHFAAGDGGEVPSAAAARLTESSSEAEDDEDQQDNEDEDRKEGDHDFEVCRRKHRKTRNRNSRSGLVSASWKGFSDSSSKQSPRQPATKRQRRSKPEKPSTKLSTAAAAAQVEFPMPFEETRAPMAAVEQTLGDDADLWLDELDNEFAEAGPSAAPGEPVVASWTLPSDKGDDDSFTAIFQPPTDLNFIGTFEAVSSHARTTDRWILVNIQCPKEFASHQLNRDTWTYAGIRTLLQSRFVLWQVPRQSRLAVYYLRFYRPQNFPHIAVVDAHTQEQKRAWSGFMGGAALTAELRQFLHQEFLQQQPPPLSSPGTASPSSGLAVALSSCSDSAFVPTATAAAMASNSSAASQAGAAAAVAEVEDFDDEEFDRMACDPAIADVNQDWYAETPYSLAYVPVPPVVAPVVETPMIFLPARSGASSISSSGDNIPLSPFSKVPPSKETSAANLGSDEDKEDEEEDRQEATGDPLQIRIRLPDGRSVQRAFLNGSRLRAVHRWCRKQLAHANSSRGGLRLILPGFPRRTVFQEADLGNTLAQLGFVTNLSLIAELTAP